MKKLRITGPDIISGKIVELEGSKSISNRVLVMRALSGNSFRIDNISKSDDTRILSGMLNLDRDMYDAGHAGTTFRFMTAFLAIQAGTQILTGSERMKQRPIGPLVEALNQLGASIEYLEKAGYPPLRIKEFNQIESNRKIRIKGNISSQYITALAMIAPVLEHGLELEITGELVSRPYLEMTLKIMSEFGIHHKWENNQIQISHQPYTVNNYVVEADWSAASYMYSVVNSCKKARIGLKGLFPVSMQGDHEISKIGESFHISSRFDRDGILWLEKSDESKLTDLTWDFVRTPDLAQTVSVMCAAHGVEGEFSGLQTLFIKETDRVKAMQNELEKFGILFARIERNPSKQNGFYKQSGKAQPGPPVQIKTYNDHRMAMAFAPLSQIRELTIEDPGVVTKSYTGFWTDLEKLGFSMIEE